MQDIRIYSKLIKIKSFEQFPRDTMIWYIKEGDVLEGYFTKWPDIGGHFQFNVKIDLKTPFPSISHEVITTSKIMEVIDDRTFRTKNSIYKISTLEDERDEKIKIVIE